MKDFLEDLKECWLPILVVVVILATVVGSTIYCFKSDMKRLKEIQAYDKEHCIRYEATSMHHRKCVCYDNEKCANFISEIP